MKSLPLVVILATTVLLGALYFLPGAGREMIGIAHTPVPSATLMYWTQPNLEPDTCIAAWLLSRKVSPGATVEISEQSSSGIPFDVPGTELQRQPGLAASDVVATRFNLTDPFCLKLVSVARELELSPWTTNDEAFFVIIRSGLADALNSSDSDAVCMREALRFLDSANQKYENEAPDVVSP